MECRILKLGYVDGKPNIPGADSKHGHVKEDSNWWSIYGPKTQSSDKFHPLLCYVWEDDYGLFAVFAESSDWKTIDKTNKGDALEDYERSNSDWKTYRCNFDILDPDPDVLPENKEEVRFENVAIRVTTKPVTKPTELSPITIGDASVVKLWPSVGSNIGIGDRIIEACLEPEIG